ncbi:MAG: site-2 protease family protein [Nanopusillaceae archaeon]
MNYQINLPTSSILEIILIFLVLNIIFIILKKIYKENTDYKFIYGIFRTKKYTEIMEKFSNSFYSKFLSFSSLLLSPIIILSSLFFLFLGIFTYTPTYVPLIPGASYGPISIPIVQSIIAIFIAAFIHEFSHGVLVFKNKLNLKSWGFFYLGPLIGAFVEPDDKEIEKISKKEQLKIYGAGSTINIIAGILFLGLFLLFSQLIISFNLAKPYVKIIGTMPNTYVYNVIPNNTILYTINNYSISYVTQIGEITKNMKPGEYVYLYTSSGDYNIKLSEIDNKTFIGIIVEQEYSFSNPSIPFTSSLLFWLFVIDIGLGIGNMLPIYPLDGGRALKSLLEMYIDENKVKKIISIISILVILLIIYNISFIL